MSYGQSSALQAAVYQHLLADPTLSALVGDAIYDAIPPGSLPSLYVSIGTETVRDRSDKTGRGAEHEFVVSVVTERPGFADAKSAAGAVSDALVDADLALSRGSLVGLDFYKATAARIGTGTKREIKLTFRARVEDD